MFPPDRLPHYLLEWILLIKHIDDVISSARVSLTSFLPWELPWEQVEGADEDIAGDCTERV